MRINLVGSRDTEFSNLNYGDVFVIVNDGISNFSSGLCIKVRIPTHPDRPEHSYDDNAVHLNDGTMFYMEDCEIVRIPENCNISIKLD